MIYGGNYGRTAYGGIVGASASVIGKIFRTGIALLFSRKKDKIVLKSK